MTTIRAISNAVQQAAASGRFELLVYLPPGLSDAELTERLAVTCSDALVLLGSAGVVALEFSREAGSPELAVDSAVRDIEQALAPHPVRYLPGVEANVKTSPYLRTKALVQAKEFLWALADSANAPVVSQPIREQAQALLEHFPTLLEIQRIHETLPELLGPVPPFSRFSGNSETINVIEAIRDAER